MSSPKPLVRYSYDDFTSLSDATDKRYELLDGDLLMVPSPATDHQRVSGYLFPLLSQYVRTQGLGEVFYAPMDVVFGEGIYREVAQPDMFYISRARFDIIAERAIQGAPDLVIEILSPSTESLDRGYKKALYARHRVQEYWIAGPQTKTVEVYGAASAGFELRGRYRLGERLVLPLLPGFLPALDEIFHAE